LPPSCTPRRPARHGLLGVEDGRQLLARERDRRRALACRLRRVGDDERDGVPRVPDRVLHEERLVGVDDADLVRPRDVLRRHDGGDAGDRERPARVEGEQPRVRDAGEDHRGVEHARGAEVVHVRGRSRDLVLGVHAADSPAHRGTAVRRVVRDEPVRHGSS